MSGDVIKSFLVGLGFDVDESSLSKFNKSITTATIRVAALSTAILGMAGIVSKAISGISTDFEQIGYQFRIISPAINKALVLRNDLLHAYAATGMNIAQVVQNSVKLNMSLARTKNILTALYQSVGSRFFVLMTQQSDQFRNTIYKNLPKIQDGLEKFIKFIFKALEAVTELGSRLWSILTRVYDFFALLDAKTDGWSTIILGVVAAWKLLNLSFLATPLGMLIAGLTALLALWDDFKTFKEGGQSLINWGSDAVKTFVALAAIVATVVGAFQAWKAATSVLSDALKIFETIEKAVFLIASLNPFSLILLTITGLVAALTILDAKFNIFGGHLSSFFSGIGGKLMGLVGGIIPSLGGGAGGIFNVGNPVGAGAQNSQSNNNVHQQTNINVIGAADANQTGKAVASQQGRVNRDMTDNMIGATR